MKDFVLFSSTTFDNNSFIPRGKVKEVATMLKAIHAQENHEEAMKKKDQIAEKLVKMKLNKAAELVRNGSPETFSFYHFPVEQIAYNQVRNFNN